MQQSVSSSFSSSTNTFCGFSFLNMYDQFVLSWLFNFQLKKNLSEKSSF